MDDQIWADLGFLTQLARNWADLLAGMKTEDFATDAEAFRTRVHETCDRLVTQLKQAGDAADRLVTQLKQAGDAADREHCRTNHVRHPHDPDGKWWCCRKGVCFHLGA